MSDCAFFACCSFQLLSFKVDSELSTLSKFWGPPPYNQFEPQLKIKNDGSIVREPSFFPEESFIIKELFSSAYQIRGNPAFRAISFLLIKFLMLPDSTKLIHQCDGCNKLFISIKTDDRIKFCSSCSSKSKMNKERRKEYQKKYRKKKKQEKLAIEHETRIKNYMINLDCTREEAETIIEADSMM